MPKKYRVDITALAEAGAPASWDCNAQDKPDAATAFIQRLEEQIGTLECNPERCSVKPGNDLLNTTYRHLLFGNHRTIFRSVGARVIILRIIHGVRLLDTGILEGLAR